MEHAPHLLEFTFLTDIAALFITWRLAHCRRAPRALAAGYLIAVMGVATLMLAAQFILVLAKQIQIGMTTQIYAFVHLEDFAFGLLLLTLPALVILFGVLFKPPPPLPGHCPKCGYDLRASEVRCPECGTAILVPAH